MTDRFRVSELFGKRLEELGIAPAAVLRQAGLPAHLFQPGQGKVWLSTEEMFAFYQAIQAVSGRPGIGLTLGSEQRLERYSPIAIAALYSRSFGDALNRIARYKRTVGPEEIEISSRGSETAVRFVWLMAEDKEPAPLADTCFASMLTVGRRGTGRPIAPSRVEFTRAETQRDTYSQFFNCPIVFNQPQNRLILRSEDLNSPFVTHNPDLLELVAPQLEAELTRQLSELSLKQQVKGILKKLLAGQRPRLEDVASELRMSARTLQRKLLLEDVTFHNAVEEARRELAQHYLLHSSLQLNETAYLLGYEDPNSFYRAFQKWEGTTPGEWRCSHQQLATA